MVILRNYEEWFEKSLSRSLIEIVRFQGAESSIKQSIKRSEERADENDISFPVIMAEGYHLFPYRTQKLRPHAPKVLGWQRPGRIGHRRILLGLWFRPKAFLLLKNTCARWRKKSRIVS